MEEVEGPKELLINNSEDKKSQSSGSLTNHEKQNNVKVALGTSEKFVSAAVYPNEKVLESFVCSGIKESDTIAPLLRSPDIANSVSFELNEGKHPSVGESDLVGEIRSLRNSGINHGNYFIPPHQSVNVMDLLTGDDWCSPQIPAGRLEDKVNFGSDTSSLPERHVHVGSLRSHPVRSKDEEISSVSDVSLSSEPHGHVHAHKNLGSKENARTELSEETVNADKKPHVDKTDSVQGLVSQNNKSSLQQEVLARKRKALALKREGKLAEAREELRQAKLLEKSLEGETPEPAGGAHDVSTSASNASSPQQKDHSAPNLAPKPLSGRDRFKLQQESLGHKRQALKMRREGRVEEAEAEFELAKALEARLDEMSSANVAEPVDDVVVEDLLDPQLLSALKAIGIEDTSIIPQGSERPGTVKVSPTQSESNSQERIQLEERIKAEKVKAINLKRAGKQAEALDALRRSKLFEKKLNSLA
ncbi:hypothetical protein SADUNF_Sadunf11G0017800 [Salix dunnii]|uniref:Uncharacterized protein n=1 Tax=Salix dunnii TaxID=1413687 RepID=A0A835MWK7_9ROSI|nr:hypothetical protein SADUNF_Sadunf11G0017800 [Salix dunnii]